jgi:predicted NBD/HSP70 family sugar kinase
MFLAIDVGGTKTLSAIFSEDGEIIAQKKINTDPDYGHFLENLKAIIDNDFKDYEISYGCCAIPGSVNRKQGLGLRFGNLNWQNVPIKQDLSRLINGRPALVEHDAALGGLSEAIVLKGKYRRVLYVAPGTGIGVALIIDSKIDSDLADNEAGHMVIAEEDGRFLTWEDLASGRALKQRYGKMASEIEDHDTWDSFSRDFAWGLQSVLAVTQPEIAVIGAGVGAHLQKFIGPLEYQLKKLENKMVRIPPVVQAKRAEGAVIYGCYEFIKQHQ